MTYVPASSSPFSTTQVVKTSSETQASYSDEQKSTGDDLSAAGDSDSAWAARLNGFIGAEKNSVSYFVRGRTQVSPGKYLNDNLPAY